MALQGTLETFALPDVLRLLSSTKKTGCYRLDGDRGTGRLWVQDGQVVAGEFGTAPPVTDPAEVAFELLRFDDGEFVFDADAEAPESGEPLDVESVLASAETMLDEWKGVAEVVPSLGHWVALQAELPTDDVTIRADTWISVVAVGGGRTVGQLGALLGLGELPVSRAVKDLIDLGLVELTEGAALVEPAPAPVAEPAFVPVEDPGSSAFIDADYTEAEPDFEIAFDGLTTPADDGPVADFAPPPYDTAAEQTYEPFDPHALEVTEPDYGSPLLDEPASAPAPAPSPVHADADPTDAAEIARQLANLSPKAAKAVAAAAKATTQEEREAALAEVDETEDPINRDLLLKFLGSVNS